MSNLKLTSIIQKEIEKNGPIPFARFMDLALYHPEEGYYSAPGDKIGWEGDFYTSSTVHPIFGELLAKQLIQMSEILESKDGRELFTIVEVGAGLGRLCHDILKEIKGKNPSLFDRLLYVIVEQSPWLLTQQKDWLSPLFPDQLSWSELIPTGFSGVLLSNELLDAFPIHRLVVDQNSVQEIHVDLKKGQFTEIKLNPSTPELNTYLHRLKLSFDQALELEINLRALDWITSVGQALTKGFVITIDYGYPAPELYSSRRPKGTFLCYYKHKTNESPYEHIGEQDMTAHIDFTSIARRGETLGLKTLGFTDQGHFLMGLGIAQRMEGPALKMYESETDRKEFLAMKQLMNPAGMGGTFKVLIQSKDIPEGVKLDGLQFRAFDPL